MKTIPNIVNATSATAERNKNLPYVSLSYRRLSSFISHRSLLSLSLATGGGFFIWLFAFQSHFPATVDTHFSSGSLFFFAFAAALISLFKNKRYI